MKISLGMLAFVLVTAPAAAQSGVKVTSVDQRISALEKARRLLEPKPGASPEELASLQNPFSGTRGTAASAPETAEGSSRPTAPASDRTLLEAMAAQIQPSGSMQLGGRHILLFGERKLRQGDYLTVKFDGVDYILQIEAIDAHTFSLRLNQDEITRSIK